MKKKLVLYFLLIVSLQLVAQNETYDVFNTSINSRFAELGISYLNDSTVIYASSKKTANDKSFVADRRRNNRQLYVDLYQGKIKDRDIINEQKFTQEVDNKFYVSDVSFTKDQKTVYFAWNNFYNTTSRKDSAKWKTLHIVKASITNDLEILNIEHLPFNSEEYSVRSPELSKDENQLFFISDMPGGYGNTDVYVVDILEDGTCSEPRNLGPNVNTKLPEMFPHAAENGTIYFSTYGHNSTGGLDIFRSNFVNGTYQKAEKLPEPINTRVDDFAFVINEANNSGFFSSTRKKGKGDADIYSFIRIPFEVECTKEISGNILDINSKEQLSNVNIQLTTNNEVVDEMTTGNDGYYSFKVDCEIEYKLEVSKENYENAELFFATYVEFEEKTIENVSMTPKDCFQTLNLEVVQQETSEILNDVTLKVFKNNEEVNIDSIENLNAINIDCNSKYKIVASKDGYITNSIFFTTSKEYNESLAKKIALSSVKYYQNFTGTIVDKNTKQELNNLKVSLISNDTVIDEINLESFKLNFTLDCNKDFKIKIEKRNYKTTELNVSTTNELKKVIFETIELEPLDCKQNINITVVNNLLKPLYGALIQLYKNEKLVKTIESNNQESILEFECENSYKIIVSKENYISQEYGFTTSRQYDLGLKKQFELVKKICNQNIKGTVTNTEDNTKVVNAKVNLYSGNNLVKTVFTNENSTYNFEINCDTNYKIVVEKADFVTSEIELTTDAEFNKTQTKDITIEPLKCNQTIVATVVDSKTKETIADIQIAIFENDKLLKTDVSTGETTFDLICKTPYRIIVSKDNFITQEYIFNTNDEHLNNLTKTIELVQKECIQTIAGIVSDSESGAILPNTKVQLFSNNDILKSTFSNEKGEYQFQINCNSDYEIVTVKPDYKIEEVIVNSTNEFNASILKNISITPIPCNQIITGKLLNDKNQEVIPNVVVKLFLNGNLVTSKTTEADGTYSFDIECNNNYKITGQHDNFSFVETLVTSYKQADTTINKNIELTPKVCSQTLDLIVVNEETNEQLNNLNLTLSKDGKIVESISLKTKTLVLNIECNSIYKISISKENYSNQEIEFTSNTDYYKKNSEIIKLKPLPCKQFISGKIVDRKLNSPIKNASLEVYSNNNLVSSHTSDASGEFRIELDCNLDYNIVTSANDYLNDLKIINTTNQYNKEFNLDIYLNDKESELFEEVENVRTAKMNPINFELNESKITSLIAKELDKLIETLTKYPNLDLQIKNHTDSRAPDAYNLNLSEDRAQSIVNYIISKGINSSRVTGKGYGETELLNKCTNNVKCSEAEHQINRRTEFIVTERE